MNHENLIVENDIAKWATTSNCKNGLPNLVRKLVVETTPLLKSVEFPLKNGDDLPKFDGFSDTLTSTKWVDEGKSYWKISRAKNLNNIESKYLERIKKVPSLCHQPSSFVFIAPRDTNHLIEESDKQFINESNEIHQVRVLNADQIASWVENTVATKQWLREQLGRESLGIQTPGAWWKNWNSNLKYELTTSFVSTRQFDESSDLINRIRYNESKISVVADTRSEAVAFVIASLFENPNKNLLDRVIVVSNENFDFSKLNDSRLIIICDFPEGVNPEFEQSKNQVIIRTYQKNPLNIHNPVNLSSVPKLKFENQLKSFGVPKAKVKRYSEECGFSIPILKRKLSLNSSYQPKWMHDSKITELLVPFALCGQFYHIHQIDEMLAPEFGNNYTGKFDDKIVLAKIGNLAEDKLDDVFGKVKLLKDSPLFQSENLLRVKSQFQLLFKIKNSIKKSHLDQYFEVINEILIESGKSAVSENQINHVNPFSSRIKYSSQLVKGLFNSFCILAIYGNAICGDRLQTDISKRIDKIVKRSLKNADAWHGVQKLLIYLAEASPNIFLDCFTNNRKQNTPKLREILDFDANSGEGDFYRNPGFRKRLFQTLETLAWHPEYFGKVANILFWLHERGASQANQRFMREKLIELFRVWLPSTMLSIEKKFQVLNINVQEFRPPVMDVYISLLPISSASGVRTALPNWRVLSNEIPLSASDSDIEHSNDLAKQFLFKLSPFNKEELSKLLTMIPKLGRIGVKKLFSEVSAWSIRAVDIDKAELRNSLFHSKMKLRSNKVELKDLIWKYTIKIDKLLTPQSPSVRHRWLFDWDYIDWTLVTDNHVQARPTNYDQQIEIVQKNAIQEILTIQGVESLLDFLDVVRHPEQVAKSLLLFEGELLNQIIWIRRVLQRDESANIKKFISQMFQAMNVTDLNKVYEFIISDNLLRNSAKQIQLVKSLPPTPIGWTIASKMGTKYEDFYWEFIKLWFNFDISKKDLKFAVNKLLKCGRAITAFNVAEPHLEKLEIRLWKKILKKMTNLEQNLEALPYENKIDDVLCLLDEDSTTTDIEIAELEVPLLSYMLEYGEYLGYRTVTWHQLFNTKPEYLILALYKRYKPKPETNITKLGIKSAKLLRIGSKPADLLLTSWCSLPSINENGTFDQKKFKIWLQTAYTYATEFALTDQLDYHLLALFKKTSEQRNFNVLIPKKFRDIFMHFIQKSQPIGFTEALKIRLNK